MSDSITTVRRPGKPEHFMILSCPPQEFVAYADGQVIARSSNVLVVRESFGRTYEPRAYFPIQDVLAELSLVTHKTSCPLKGQAFYFDVTLGGLHRQRGAWAYQEVLDFDVSLRHLKERVAFDGVDIEGF